MSFWKELEDSIQFELFDGNITRNSYYPFSTGWRSLPFAVFVLNEGGSYLLELKGKKRHLSEDGESILVPPNVEHRFTVGEYCNVTSTWIHFNFTMMTAIDLFSNIEFPWIYSKKASRALRADLDYLVSLNEIEIGFSEAIRRKTHGFAFMHALMREAEIKTNAQEMFNLNERILPVLNFIRENIKSKISRSQLARMVHLSENRFNIVFKSATGLSPSEYIKRERLKICQRLLIQTEKSVGEVGREVGIDDPFYFSKIFKSHFKMSPLSYRKRTREYFSNSPGGD